MDKTKRDGIIREFEQFVQNYTRDLGFTSYDEEVLKGVLALLKAQEPVEPIRMNVDKNKYRDWYRCPVCKTDLYHEQQYCEACGRAVKWE